MNGKRKPKHPPVPIARLETVRKEIISLLEGRMLSAREISVEAGIPEKDVYEHLAHIQKTVGQKGLALSITPAECRKCGFIFRKRHRLAKPGKCPVCRETTIGEPLFSIK